MGAMINGKSCPSDGHGNKVRLRWFPQRKITRKIATQSIYVSTCSRPGLGSFRQWDHVFTYFPELCSNVSRTLSGLPGGQSYIDCSVCFIVTPKDSDLLAKLANCPDSCCRVGGSISLSIWGCFIAKGLVFKRNNIQSSWNGRTRTRNKQRRDCGVSSRRLLLLLHGRYPYRLLRTDLLSF